MALTSCSEPRNGTMIHFGISAAPNQENIRGTQFRMPSRNQIRASLFLTLIRGIRAYELRQYHKAYKETKRGNQRLKNSSNPENEITCRLWKRSLTNGHVGSKQHECDWNRQLMMRIEEKTHEKRNIKAVMSILRFRNFDKFFFQSHRLSSLRDTQ